MKIWISRDKGDNYLYLYKEKPYKEGNYFHGKCICYVDEELFPEVTFENSPQQIEINLIKKA